ncbi:MAG: hypothetical protein M3Z19_19175 [Chloroflexota bacterium]|nr:hypothetical protein [Chloroflexota bacterium]
MRKSAVQRSVILGAPLAVGIADLTHPTFTKEVGIYHGVLAHLNWWIILHLVQIPLFALLGLAAYFLLDGIAGPAARVSRCALAVFLVVYPAFDTLIGVGTGILVKNAMHLPVSDQATIAQAIDAYWRSPIAFIIAVTGADAWNIGVLFAALALARPRWGRSPVVFAMFVALLVAVSRSALGYGTPAWWAAILVASTAFAIITQPSLAVGLLAFASFLFAADHAPPLGPLGMLCFLLAAFLFTIPAQKTPPSSVGKGVGG